MNFVVCWSISLNLVRWCPSSFSFLPFVRTWGQLFVLLHLSQLYVYSPCLFFADVSLLVRLFTKYPSLFVLSFFGSIVKVERLHGCFSFLGSLVVVWTTRVDKMERGGAKSTVSTTRERFVPRQSGTDRDNWRIERSLFSYPRFASRDFFPWNVLNTRPIQTDVQKSIIFSISSRLAITEDARRNWRELNEWKIVYGKIDCTLSSRDPKRVIFVDLRADHLTSLDDSQFKASL